MTHVRLTFDTTCEHVQKLAEQLTELDVASEMSIPRNESRTCRLATEHLCRKLHRSRRDPQGGRGGDGLVPARREPHRVRGRRGVKINK